MAKAFDSACASPLGAAIESPLGAKDCPGGFLYATITENRTVSGFAVLRARVLRVSFDGDILNTYVSEEYHQNRTTFITTTPTFSLSFDGNRLWGLLRLETRPPSLSEGSITSVAYELVEFAPTTLEVVRRVPVAEVNTGVDRFGQHGFARLAVVGERLLTLWVSFVGQQSTFSAYWQLYDKSSLAPIGQRIPNTTLPATSTIATIDGYGDSLWALWIVNPNIYTLYRLSSEDFRVLQTFTPPPSVFMLGVTSAFVYLAAFPDIVYKLASDTLEQQSTFTLNLSVESWRASLVDIAGGSE